MSLLPTPYESFQSSNPALVQNGGLWTGGDTACAQITTETGSSCGGVCLSAQVFPPDSSPSYHPTFSTNISVTLANYGGATNLDFTWSYWPLFTSQNTTANTAMPIHSQVGGNSYDDSSPAVDWNTFWNGGHTWTTDTLTHSGSVSVSSDGTHGYVPISIRFTMTPNNHNEYMNYLVKGIVFSIKGATAGSLTVGNAPSSASSQNSAATSSAQTSAQSGSGSSTSSSASSSRSLIPVDPLHTTLGGSSSNSTVPVGDPSSNSADSTSSTPVGLIAGATIGGIVFLVLLTIAFFLFLRKNQKQQNRQLAMPPTEYKETLKDEQSTHLQDRDLTSEHRVANANHWVNVTKPLPPNEVEEARSRAPAWAVSSSRSTPNQPGPPLVPPYVSPISGAATAGGGGGGEESTHPKSRSGVGRRSHSIVSAGGSSPGAEREGSSVASSAPAWVAPMLGGADSQSETSDSQRQPFSSGALSSSFPANHPTSSRPTSMFSSNTSAFDPPPLYPTSELSHRGESRVFTRSLLPSAPALAQFAALHRVQIGQDLEARLQLAGWLPTDDPSNLSAEEWRDDYGVTRLELMRLQGLYTQHRKQREQAALESVQEAEAEA